MFNFSYKLVSDWNFSTGFENFDRSGAFISVDASESYSSKGSSYSMIDIDGIKYGVYSKSNSSIIHMFKYDGSELINDQLEELSSPLVGLSPRIGVNPSSDAKYSNAPFVIYYDTELGILRIIYWNNIDDSYFSELIEKLPVKQPFGNHVFGVDYNGSIKFAFIYNPNGRNAIRYGEFKNDAWSFSDVPIHSIIGGISTVSITSDNSGNTYVFTGGSDGLYCYRKSSTDWYFEGFQVEETGVSEIDVRYSITGQTHISYISNSEARYQKFDHYSKLFNESYKFIDFNSSSVSLSLDSLFRPVISYSHIEEMTPLFIYLKYAKSDEDGDVWNSYNLTSSNSGFKTGAFSEALFDGNDNLFIMYMGDGVTLYNGAFDKGGATGDSIIWKDATYRNNLISSSSPPSANIGASFVEFTRSKEQYFYISDILSKSLNQSNVFSISFLISPRGDVKEEQTIISHDGYSIFLGGDDGLTLSFRMETTLQSIEVGISSIPQSEFSKVSFVYSGYDVKVYIKNTTTEEFEVYKYNINGRINNIGLPFTVGASAISIIDAYTYPITSSQFSSFLDSRMSFIKFWKRELNYNEATYDDSAVDYDSSVDPYAGDVDYVTIENGFGVNYFYLKGEEFSVDDLGGVGTISLLDYSKFNQEERVTNSFDLSFDPYGFKGSKGGTNLLWSDKVSGNSDIYMMKSNSYNRSNRSDKASYIKSSGFGGLINSLTNVLTDSNANFLKDGVVIGDYINITSGSNHVGRKIPILKVLGKSQIELGVYFQDSITDIGYYIDSNKVNNIEDAIVRIASIDGGSSLSPIGVSDSLGDSHIVWQSYTNGAYGVFYNRYRPSFDDDQSLGIIRIDDGLNNAVDPDLAISSEDMLHIVWQSHNSSIGSILYSMSTSVRSSNGDVPIVRWGSSSYGGNDIVISEDIDAQYPKIVVDSNGIVHIVFVGKIGSEQKVYYVNNLYGNFSNPVVVANYTGVISSIDMAVSPTDDILLVLSADIDGVNDIYVIKRDSDTQIWSSSQRVLASSNNSIKPSVSIGTNNIGYIFWTERSSFTSVMNYAEYDISNGNISLNEYKNISSSPNNSLTTNTLVDDTNTIFTSWQDNRVSSSNTEIFKNTLTTLNTYSDTDEDNADENSEALLNISETLGVSNIVVGNKFPEIIPESSISASVESLDSLVIVFEDELNSYTTVGGKSAVNIVLESRSIKIKIEGLSNTLAYRVKNNDESGAMFSEFLPFSVNENPNTTVFDWLLSSGNNQKEICIQLYTIQGITSMICVPMFLNQSRIFQVSLFRGGDESIGEEVDTLYDGKSALRVGIYWARIEFLSYVSLDTERVVFDIIMQGNNILDVETEFVDGYFVGSFNIQSQDDVRYIDGDAKIIAKVIDK